VPIGRRGNSPLQGEVPEGRRGYILPFKGRCPKGGGVIEILAFFNYSFYL